MKKLYYCLFYGAFVNGKKSTKIEQSDKSAAVIAVLFFSTLISMNVFSILFVLESFGLCFIDTFVKRGEWTVFLIMGVVLFFNYMVFMYKQKFVTIKHQFESKPEKYCKCTMALWVGYVVLSVFFLIVSVRIHH